MIKRIDRIQGLELVNAFKVLETHGLIDHSNFFTEHGSNKDIYAYVIKRKSIRISQMGRMTYQLEEISHE